MSNDDIRQLETERDTLRTRLDDAEHALYQAGLVSGEMIVDLRRRIGELQTAIAHALTLMTDGRVEEAAEELQAVYHSDAAD
jgi:hypothetical protein